MTVGFTSGRPLPTRDGVDARQGVSALFDAQGHLVRACEGFSRLVDFRPGPLVREVLEGRRTVSRSVSLSGALWQLLAQPLTDARGSEPLVVVALTPIGPDLGALEFLAARAHPPLAHASELPRLNTQRTVLDAVGPEALAHVARDYLELLETSSAVFETNGDYAQRLHASSWCRLLERASRERCNTPDDRQALASGRWHCHESCWGEAGRPAVETGRAVDVPCRGGIRATAVPIRAGSEVVGAIVFGHGDPPRDPATLAVLSERYGVSRELLLRAAADYRPRPAFVVELARRRLEGAARLLGEMVVRHRAESERARLVEVAQAERRRAEEAGRLKDEFLATLSHELRTPLTAILGWAQMLKSGTYGPGALQRGLSTIERNARAQKQLIDDLLDTSRIINGKLRLEVRPLELWPLVEAALESSRPAAEAKGVLLEVLPPEGPTARVAGDPDRLQQVVWNLVSNATKFTPAGGRVRISLARAGGEWVLSVADTGMGIRAEFLPYVFDRFRQFDSSSTRTHGGLGLGLAIVRHLVELHGGAVAAESAGMGHGATFRVHLPCLLAEREAQQPDADEPSAEDGRLAGTHLLVVDDEPDSAEVVALALKAHGARVSVAHSAAEALRRVASERFDAVLCDLGMPDEDGFDLLRQVRALPHEAGGQTPVVALTAWARAEDEARTHAAGFAGHVAKPVNLEQLVAAVVAVWAA